MKKHIYLYVLIFTIAFFAGCKSKPPPRQSARVPAPAEQEKMQEEKVATAGNTVYLEFTATFPDGSVYEQSHPDFPMKFVFGEEKTMKQIENNIEGMRPGESSEFDIDYTQVYGEHNPAYVGDMPKANFPPDFEFAVGRVISMTNKEGTKHKATIVEVNDDTVKVDMNHPLAGKKLHYKVKILAVE